MSFVKQKDFQLRSAEIIKPLENGTYETIDVSELLISTSIYQDIFNSVMSGKVLLLDTNDLISTLPLTGNEFFKIGIDYPDTSLTSSLQDSLSFAESSNLIQNIDSVISNIDFNNFGDFLGNYLSNFFFANAASLPSISNLFSSILGMTDFKKKTVYSLFRIYKSDNSTQFKDNARIETLRLVAPEYIWNLQTKFNKNFKNEQISSVVASYFTDLKNFYQDTHPALYNDKLKQDALMIEETVGLLDYSSIQANPFTIINKLSTLAIAKEDESANYVFYQNNIGFNFRSLASIFNQTNTLQFFSKNPNLPDDKQQAFKYDALSFECLHKTQNFDVMNNIREGLYSSKLLSIDPLRRKFHKKDYRLTEEFFKYSQNDTEKNLQIENNFEALNNANNRMMLCQSTLGHDAEPYLRALDDSMIDERVEHTTQLRTSQMRLLEQAKVFIRLPGHPSINAGQKCSFNMPSFNALDQATQNKYLQGSYIITACAHHITRETYEVETELVKTNFYSRIQYTS